MAVNHQLITTFLGSYKFPTMLGQEILQSSDDKIAFRISEVYRKLFKNQKFSENIISNNGLSVGSFSQTQQQLFEAILQWKQQEQLCEIMSLHTAQAYLPQLPTVTDAKIDVESPCSNDTQFIQLFTNPITGNTTRSAPQTLEENMQIKKDPFFLESTKGILYHNSVNTFSENRAKCKSYLQNDLLSLTKIDSNRKPLNYETPKSRYHTPTNYARISKQSINDVQNLQVPNNSPVSSSCKNNTIMKQEALYNLLNQTSKVINSENFCNHQTESNTEKADNILDDMFILQQNTDIKQIKNKIRTSIESVETQASWAPSISEDMQDTVLNIQNIYKEALQLKRSLNESPAKISKEVIQACYHFFGLDPDLTYCAQQITSSFYNLISTTWLNFWFNLKKFVEIQPNSVRTLSIDYLNIVDQFENLPDFYETVKQAYDICYNHSQQLLYNFNKNFDIMQLKNMLSTNFNTSMVCRKVALSDLELLNQQKSTQLSTQELKNLRREVLDSFVNTIVKTL